MESPAQTQNLFSRSAIVRYAVISAINLAILLVGIAIGVTMAPRIEPSASAASGQQVGSAATQTPSAGGVKLTPVQPGMQVGTVAAYLSLAHHIQSDELVVNGINLLQLHQEEINLLAKFVPQQEINNAIARSKATELYTVATPKPATPTPAAPAPK